MKENIETFCGMNLFSYNLMDFIDDTYLIFYAVEWCCDSMKQYNGLDVTRNLEGWMEIADKDGKFTFGFHVIDIPDIRNMILSRIPEEMKVLHEQED